jgi:hypothetical protein
MSIGAAIVAIKVVHMGVFFFVSCCILYELAITGRTSARLFWPALLIPLLVGEVWLANGRECPMATAIYDLSGNRLEPDLYLPAWFTRWIMLNFALANVTGALLAGYRALTGN